MTRAAFLSMIGLGAAGQEYLPAPKIDDFTVPTQPSNLKFQGPLEYKPVAQLYMNPNGNWYLRNSPANGECPCCGTQAPPYQPKTYTVGGTCKEPESFRHSHTAGCHKPLIIAEDKTRRIECANCRVIFGQDAEPEK
jgi:hypothetical protein